ncbi:cytochrome P450 1A5-like [Saccoglossus kowalevskii]|uniref:Cytochrome P450 1A5-like n=1 Tax=Saccoglossus kowalevskii TaxID=10224 RepID=A0ABM0MYC0_SACKO|nr:PREDICTED: cytochrome P450 1A5-like [Saccoglossus kowalevskii]
MINYILESLFDNFNTPGSIILLVSVFILSYGLIGLRKPPGFPPGPMGYPFVGNMLDLEEEPHLTLAEYGKKYGDVFTIKIGSRAVIILNSLEAIKEALVKKQNDFAGRPYFYSLSGLMAEECQNIVFGNFTAKWQLQRNIGHQAIRNYASGKKLEALLRCNAFPSFQRAVAKMKKRPFYPRPLLHLLVGNIIVSMCFGKKYELDDPEFINCLRVLSTANASFGSGLVADFIPVFRHIPTFGLTRIKKSMQNWLDLIQHKIDEHKKTFDEGNEDAKSLVGEILSIQRKARLSRDQETEKQLTDVNLRQTVADMFGAGLDTVVNTLEWAIAYLACYPDVQAKVRREIDDVIRDRRLPLLSDKGKLPYCEAVINEVMRIRTVSPFAIPHATTVDTSVGGYTIPKDTWVWCNLWNLHMSEKYWVEPEEFRPERFLNTDGNAISKPDSFMPFSAGRRACMGETLAKNELFLIFTSLFQQYTFKTPTGGKTPCLEAHCMTQFTRCCQYEVKAVARRN